MSDKQEEAIIGMYSRGMTTSDISDQVKEVYDLDVSEGTISNVTNRITEHVKNWQNRPLEPVYFTVWMDGIVLKVKQNGKYINKCIYLVIGLKNDGLKEVLGMWMAETESASFWMSVLTDLKARGIEEQRVYFQLLVLKSGLYKENITDTNQQQFDYSHFSLATLLGFLFKIKP